MPTLVIPSWEDLVHQAMKNLGGSARPADLNREMERLRRTSGHPLSATWPATVRRVLQQSEHFVQDRKHSGFWRLNGSPPTSR